MRTRPGECRLVDGGRIRAVEVDERRARRDDDPDRQGQQQDQFHPTGIVGPGILASEALRSEGGILRNKEMEPFMDRYAPKMKDLAPRDIVARAIDTEIQEGRGMPHSDHQIEHVWIDLRHLPDYVHEVKLKEVASFFKTYANLDSRTQLCPVRPSNDYHMGGIPTNEHGEVQNAANKVVPGLFAIGE